jgi:CHC2 zinc finger
MAHSHHTDSTPSADAERLATVLDGHRVGNHWEARCPAHEDRHPSFHITERDGKVLFKCWAGCSQAAVIEALEQLRLWGSGGEGTRPYLTLVGQSDASLGLTLEALAEHKKLPVDFLQSLGLTTITYDCKPAVRIPYLDESGQLVSTRFRVSLQKEDGIDRFKWKKGDRACLYGLWRLEEARKAGRIVLVEGESCCHTLWYQGIPAIGVPGATNWKPERDEPKLNGISKIFVVIEPDKGGDDLLRLLTS